MTLTIIFYLVAVVLVMILAFKLGNKNTITEVSKKEVQKKERSCDKKENNCDNLDDIIDLLYNEGDKPIGYIISHKSVDNKNSKCFDVIYLKRNKTKVSKIVSNYMFTYSYDDCPILQKFLSKFSNYVYLVSWNSRSANKNERVELIDKLVSIGFKYIEIKKVSCKCK